MKSLNRFFLLFILFVISCTKEETQTIALTPIELPIEGEIHEIKFLNTQIGYACGGIVWENGFLLKTIDGGFSWDIIHQSDNIIYSIDFLNEDTIALGGFSGRIWRTFDAGNSWTLTELGPSYLPIKALKYTSNNTILFASGFKYFIGGKGWYNTITNDYFSPDTKIAMEDLYLLSPNEVMYCGYGYMYKSENSGASFIPIEVPSGYYKALDFEGNEGVCVSHNGKVIFSSDRGNTWDVLTKKGHTFEGKNKLEDIILYRSSALVCGENGIIYNVSLRNDELIKLSHNYMDEHFYSIYPINQTVFLGADSKMYKFSY